MLPDGPSRESSADGVAGDAARTHGLRVGGPCRPLSRATLLNVLDAIGKQRDAVVLVGAQANYLHTGDSDMVVPAFTSDGHLAIETPLKWPGRAKG